VPDGDGLFRDIPTPKLNEHGLVRDDFGNLRSRFREDLDLIIGEVVLVQVRDLARIQHEFAFTGAR